MSHRGRFGLYMAAWVAAAAATTSVGAAIIRVDGSLPSSGNGSTWPLAYNNLQTAINVAGPSDQIWVKAGTYKPGTTRTSSFVLKNNVRIFGGFAGTEGPTQLALRNPVVNVTILSGDIGVANDPSDNCYHVVKATGKLDKQVTVLDGFTITGGNADDPRQIDIRGGGIYIESTASGENNACRPLFVRCILKDNNASDNGGAVVAIGEASVPPRFCEPEFVSCAFYGNSAGASGGGIAAQVATVRLMNAIFSGNDAGSSGGGVASFGNSTVRAVNTTFSANSATTTGGMASVGMPAGALEATNTILWGNTGGSTTEGAQISAVLDTANYCCIQGLTGALGGTGNIGSNPNFVDANGADNVTGTSDDDVRLQSGSPCNDVGDDPSVLADVGDLDYDNNFTEPAPYDVASTRRFALDDAAGLLGPCDGVRVDMGAHENGDCDGDGTPDEQETDSNGDGIPDSCQDCDGDSLVDPIEIVLGTQLDCNNNGIPDDCDIDIGCSSDINENGVPDDCECAMDIVFVVDASGSIAGSGTNEQEIEPICDMIDQIEAALPPAPLVRSIRVAVADLGLSPNPACLTQDVEAVTGFDNEASNEGNCDGVIGPEDWVNAVELLADEYDWRPDSIRVIVPISDEGGCLGATCSSTNASILAAIAAANAAGCIVYPVIGIESDDTCAETAGTALASGTDGATWAATTVDDYTETGGIGDQLSERLTALLSSCLGLCPADLDGDSLVGPSDLGILLGAWGPCTGGCPADLDNDGQVGPTDLGILLGAWGWCGLPIPNRMSSMSGGSNAESELTSWQGTMTPQELAEALGLSSVAELAEYLGSLDFETMQAVLQTFFGG